MTMILNGCVLSQGSGYVNYRACKPAIPCSIFSCKSQRPAKAIFSSIQSSSLSNLGCKSWLLRGVPLSDMRCASSLLLRGGQSLLVDAIPMLPRRQRLSYMTPKAGKDAPYSFRYPPMTKKPRWWWRTLACLTYLLPLHETWMYAETAYHLHPFLEYFEFLTYPFLRSIGRMPRWSLIVYFVIAYLGIVRRKEWPHFFRFHVATGMLLEISLQVTGLVSRWVPRKYYWGLGGMHFWMVVSFGFLFTVLECIRCALSGMYADIPFVSDAAYIQIPHDG